jgi:glycosyltransferase involved in cell wall biosynthesis
VLLVCPEADLHDVGESLYSFLWVSHLAQACEVTLLAARWPDATPHSLLFPDIEVVEWATMPLLSRPSRFNSTVKPGYGMFYFQVRAWLKEAIGRGRTFDLLHQISPMAMRFPSPLAGFERPYIIGPVGGSLPTPPGFRDELGTEPAFAKLRRLDGWRLRHDPWLRQTYENAQAVIGSGPYVQAHLSHFAIRRFHVETEVGIDGIAGTPFRSAKPPGHLRMLHVGRTVRTKGLRDAIRAMAKLADLPNITLDVAGDGEDMEACRKEAAALGVSSRIRFLGWTGPQEVERLTREADLFLFPSFREPTGIVLFEAMRSGLPVITTNLGGPGYIVTDDCGIRVEADNPEQFATDLASAIRSLALDPQRRQKLGAGAHARVAELGLWPNKIDRTLRLYREVIESTGRIVAHA